MSSSTIIPVSPSVQRLFASFAVPSVSATLPVTIPQQKQQQQETPKKSSSTRAKKTRHSVAKRQSPQPCFASGSFSESPAARIVPPPPMTWVFGVEEPLDNSSGCESDVSCSTDSASTSSPSRDEMKTPEPGFRVNPLQLIAAVVSA